MKIKIDIEVTLYRIADLLCCAFEGGSMWVDIRGYRQPKAKINMDLFDGHYKEIYKYLHYPLFEGGRVKIKDSFNEESPLYILDLASIQKGLQLFADKSPSHFGDWHGENEDAITGDVFLQYCLFGECRY